MLSTAAAVASATIGELLLIQCCDPTADHHVIQMNCLIMSFTGMHPLNQGTKEMSGQCLWQADNISGSDHTAPASSEKGLQVDGTYLT